MGGIRDRLSKRYAARPRERWSPPPGEERGTKRVPTAISSNCEISHCAARFYARKTAKDTLVQYTRIDSSRQQTKTARLGRKSSRKSCRKSYRKWKSTVEALIASKTDGCRRLHSCWRLVTTRPNRHDSFQHVSTRLSESHTVSVIREGRKSRRIGLSDSSRHDSSR